MDNLDINKLVKSIDNLNGQIHSMSTHLRTVDVSVQQLVNETKKNSIELQHSIQESKKHRSGRVDVSQETSKYLEDIKNVILSNTEKAHNKKGGINKVKERQLNKVAEEFRPLLNQYFDMYRNAFLRDHKDSTIKPYEDKAYVDLIRNMTSTMGETVGSLSTEITKVREILNVSGSSKENTVMDSRKMYERRTNKNGEIDYVSINNVFAQTKSDAKKLAKELQELSRKVEQVKDTANLTNDVVLDLATNSDAVNKIMLDMNVNLEMANDNLRIFNMLLNSVGNAQWQQTTQINNNIQAMGNMQTVLQQFQQSMTELTSANIRALNKVQQAQSSSSSGGSSFREQATRNSDRAKQAGFIALLIPALAKLLKKNTFADLLRLAMLKFGSGKSGKGDNALAGAIGYSLVPLIMSGITAGVFRKQLMGLGGRLLGIPQITKTASRLGGGFNPFNVVFNPRTSKNWMQVVNGFKQGWNLPEVASGMRGGYNSINRARLLRNIADVNNVNRLSLSGGRTAVATLTGKTGYITQYNAALMGENFRRFFTPLSKGFMGAKALTKSPFVSGALKFAGGAAKKLPLLGALFDVGEDVFKGKSFGKSVLSAGTATAVGMATGGVGFLAYPLIKGLVDGLTGNLDKNSKQWAEQKKEELGWRNGFGAKVIDVLAGIGEAIQWIVQPIQGIWNWIKEKFHIGSGNIDDPNLSSDDKNKIYNDVKKKEAERQKNIKNLQKDNKNIDNKLKKVYSDPNSVDYKKRHGELQTQYIRANTKKGTNKTVAQKLGFGERDPELLKAASAWADKMMNEEKYQLTAQKNKNSKSIASLENAVGTSIPENLKVTKNRNGIDVVALADLNLKGRIGSENSDPRIAARNAQGLKYLDNFIGSNHKFKYSSAMGGHSSGGHVKGNKVDVVTEGSVLTPEEYESLFRMGYFGGKTGAIGYEYVKGQTKLTTPSEYRKLYKAGKVSMAGNNHYDLAASSSLGAAVSEYKEKNKIKSETGVSTPTVEQTASSSIERNLAEIVNKTSKNAKQEKTRNIVLSAVDVTGSLGVWGITQLNNGVMSQGGR